GDVRPRGPRRRRSQEQWSRRRAQGTSHAGSTPSTAGARTPQSTSRPRRSSQMATIAETSDAQIRCQVLLGSTMCEFGVPQTRRRHRWVATEALPHLMKEEEAKQDSRHPAYPFPTVSEVGIYDTEVR